MIIIVKSLKEREDYKEDAAGLTGDLILCAAIGLQEEAHVRTFGELEQ